MWRLEKLNGELVALLPVNGQEQYTVGRRDSDILLADKSVSRAHAVLRLDGGELWVMDLGSKFGSQLGAARLVKDERSRLVGGDHLTFGATQLTVVLLPPFEFCCSGLSRKETEALRPQIEALGGKLHKEWMPAVTHVVMTRMRVTPKLLYALVTATPIVTPQWLALAAARTRADEPLPECSDVRCVPPLGPGLPEAVQQVRAERALLFKGRRFAWLGGDGAGEAAQQARHHAATILELMGAEPLCEAATDADAVGAQIDGGTHFLFAEDVAPGGYNARNIGSLSPPTPPPHPPTHMP